MCLLCCCYAHTGGKKALPCPGIAFQVTDDIQPVKNPVHGNCIAPAKAGNAGCCHYNSLGQLSQQA